MTGNERRNGNRHLMDMPITRQQGDAESDTCTTDLSPGGVRLRRPASEPVSQPLCNLELHLVPGSITTVIAARRVWQDDDFEAYEFVSPSFSQQMLIEKMVGNL